MLIEITPNELFERIGRLTIENERLHAALAELEAKLEPKEEPADEPQEDTI